MSLSRYILVQVLLLNSLHSIMSEIPHMQEELRNWVGGTAADEGTGDPKGRFMD